MKQKLVKKKKTKQNKKQTMNLNRKMDKKDTNG